MLGKERHDHVRDEMLEVMLLAEELGVVGRQRVDEELHLLIGIVGEIASVFLECRQAERAQAAARAPLNQGQYI